MKSIRIAIVGIGNCASALIQGLDFYSRNKAPTNIGLMHEEIGGYKLSDIEVVAAFDVDSRKVGKDLTKAIFQPPNCAMNFSGSLPPSGVKVSRGKTLDGIAPHMGVQENNHAFLVSATPEPSKAQVLSILKTSGAEMVLNYLPVGSVKATEFYAACALDANIGFINNIPVFIASDPLWSQRFADRGLPIIGDDIKSQVGATIIHRALAKVFKDRGAKLVGTYQLNIGGNTDFLNMLDRSRLEHKKISKTEAVVSQADDELTSENIHIGPSDWVPSQRDNKTCFIQMDGIIFGETVVKLDLKLSVEDSPNSAGVVIDAIRCCKLALDWNIGGALYSASAFFMKHPPVQLADSEALELTERFIATGQDFSCLPSKQVVKAGFVDGK